MSVPLADSISDALLTLAQGQAYRLPEALREVAIQGLCRPSDLRLFEQLARHLVRQHRAVIPVEPGVYRDALRGLLAGADGVLAVIDALPTGKQGHEVSRLQGLERRFLGWRWRLRERDERLRQVHRGLRLEQVSVLPGPDVIVFDPRLQPGDPALDVSAVAVGLLELGAREPLCWSDGYRPLFDAFWSTYLGESGDHELLDVAPPFLASRALLAASPLAPSPLPPAAQRQLFSFAEEALAQRSFDPDAIRWLER